MSLISRPLAQANERKRKIMTGAARHGRTGKLISLKGGHQTFCELDPPSDGPLMVCIHGWSTASYVWEPLKPAFRAKGYRVLSYDLYGRGFSDRPIGAQTAEFFVAQLNDLLEKLKLHQGPITVVGYSMGGAIAAQFVSARLARTARLLLIAPAGMEVRSNALRGILRSFPRSVAPLAEVLLAKKLPQVFDKEAAGFQTDPGVAKVLAFQKRELTYQGYLPALVSSLQGILSAKMERAHKDIAAHGLPVKAIFAAEDETIPRAGAEGLLAEWNPAATRHVIEGTGHGITYTHPGKIMDAVGDFLDLQQ